MPLSYPLATVLAFYGFVGHKKLSGKAGLAICDYFVIVSG